MDIRGSFYCNLNIIDQFYKFINGYPTENDSKLEPLLSKSERIVLEPPSGIKKMNFEQLFDIHPLT